MAQGMRLRSANSASCCYHTYVRTTPFQARDLHFCDWTLMSITADRLRLSNCISWEIAAWTEGVRLKGFGSSASDFGFRVRTKGELSNPLSNTGLGRPAPPRRTSSKYLACCACVETKSVQLSPSLLTPFVVTWRILDST
eukprot:scaffold113131_cov22-Tisochrysis_lutea.AAC.1